MVYRFDPTRGMLEPHPAPWVKTKPGAGPRHVAFDPGGRFAYLVNELDSTVAALAYDRTAGTFEYLQSVSTLPEGYEGASTCADIHVSASGDFVYASNRGHNTIAIFRRDPQAGTLRSVGHESTQGKTPRSFAIEPGGRFLLAANQDSDSIVSFRIDPETGKLRPTGHVASVPTPVCVKFLSSQTPGTLGASG